MSAVAMFSNNEPDPAGIVPSLDLSTKLAEKGLVAGSVDCRPPSVATSFAR
jgi:hypothetical protein